MKRSLSLNKGWTFAKPDEKAIKVDVPHNWNSKDGQDGGNDYFRGICTYTKKIGAIALEEGEEVYLEFQGVNASCSVYLNDTLLGKHDGGYSTFRFLIDKKIINENNNLKVEVDNTVNENVYPQKADFTFYGGIYRDVSLIFVNKDHFSLKEFGSCGADIDVYVENEQGIINVKPNIVGKGKIKLTLLDDKNKEVASSDNEKLEIKNPHLWNGLEDPYLYSLSIKLINGEEVSDEIIKNVGFRTYSVDPKKGFYLNGKLVPLRGVSRHQDRRGLGNSLTKEHMEEDMKNILEIGANTVRLAHYQHNDYFLDLCDKYGLVVWAEIPYISKHIKDGNDNLVSQMSELVTQQKHHSSILFWGVSNEITMFRGHQKELMEENKVLNELCHKLDPHRLTTMACFAMCGPFNPVAYITDIVSWNFYFGWYTPFLWLNKLWFDFYHTVKPKRSVGLSEYGAEGMMNLHSNHPHRGDSTEEYQLIYHEYLLRFLSKRPWIWASHVWNMFDFGSDGRNQGGEPGVNHKGLMDFDHKVKKDSYYICKAYWNNEPMTFIAGKRFANRNGSKTKVRIITNEPKLEVFVNGKLFKVVKNKKYVALNIPLKSDIAIFAKGEKSEDNFTFKKVAKFDENYKLHAKSNNYSWEK